MCRGSTVEAIDVCADDWALSMAVCVDRLAIAVTWTEGEAAAEDDMGPDATLLWTELSTCGACVLYWCGVEVIVEVWWHELFATKSPVLS